MRPFSFTYYETVKHSSNFSRPSSSFAMFNSKKDRSGLRSEDMNKQDTEKLLRKYFNKKLASLLCFHKSSSSASAYRCKTLKSLKAYGPLLQRSPIRLLKKMGLYYDTKVPLAIPDNGTVKTVRNHTLLDQISGFKCLEVLNINAGPQLSSLRPIKSLRSLKELTLTANTNQIAENSRTFLRLKSLTKFKLFLSNSRGPQHPDQPEAIADFCMKLLSLKGLESVYLNLKCLSFNQNSRPIERLFDTLKQAQLPNFHIELTLPSLYNIDTKKVQMILDNVDLFTLNHITGTSIGFNNQKSAQDQSIPQAKKRLDVTVSHYGIPLLVRPVQQLDQPFKLCESLSSVFKQGLDRSFPLLDNLNAENLRSFTFSFEKVPEQKYDIITMGLAHILKYSPSLKHLSIKGLRIDPFANHQYAQQNQAILEGISYLQDLEDLYLEDISLAEASFSLLTKMLAYLTNLKRLHLSFNIKFDPKAVSSFLSFEQLAKLVELKIKLPTLNCQSQASFIENLAYLHALEVLDIQRGSQLCKNTGLRWKLFKGVQNLKQLKTAEMSSEIPTITSFYGNRENDGQNNRKIAEDIRANLEALFGQNSKIEKFAVIEHNHYEISATRYD